MTTPRTLREKLQPHFDELAAARAAGDVGRWRAAEDAKRQVVSEEMAAHADLTSIWSVGRFTIALLRPARVHIVSGTPVLDLLIDLRRDGVRVPVDGHIRLVNPPFRVPDGVDAEGEPVYRDAPGEALRTVVWEVLAGQMQQALAPPRARA